MSNIYRKKKSRQTLISVCENGRCIGIFPTFKIAVNALSAELEKFPSYWTLIRKERVPFLDVAHLGEVYRFEEHQIGALILKPPKIALVNS